MMEFVPQGKFAEGLNENGRKIGCKYHLIY